MGFRIILFAAAARLCLGAGSAASASTMLPSVAPPANDNFANAFVLSGQSVTRTDTNVDATLEAGEDPNIAGSTGGASVWYSWTAPVDGQGRVDTLASGFDTRPGVFSGSAVNSLTEVASNDDCCGGFTSRVRFHAIGGVTYRIRVDGFNNGSTIEEGVVGLDLLEAQPPANDDFATPTA